MLDVVSGENEPLDGKGPKAAQAEPGAPWYAVWTHSHCEQLVTDQLSAKGFELFFPKTTSWKQRGAARQAVQKPLFPGYVFVRNELDKHGYVEVIKARGVVRVLGDRWDALSPIPCDEIDSIRRVVATDTPLVEHPHLTLGDHVRIISGPLTGLAGIYLRSKPGKGLLVLSVTLLHRSVALEVPVTLVEAA
jgi:transcriptional antiterminator NusG